MELKNRRTLIRIVALIAAFLLVTGGAVLADAYGLIGPKETDCCANGFDPGPSEPPRPIPAGKL